MTRTADVAVVGAGVVGLAVARQLAMERPAARIVVFDKESRLALHASGRNSGVIHAGFYYSPDSLKARLTRRGNVLLHDFCADRGVPVRRTGKVVVATHEEQLGGLEELAARAAANGVPVALVDERRLRAIEPLARTVSRALWSPSTSAADPLQVVAALAADAAARGVAVRLGEPVLAARPGQVRTAAGSWAVGHVVNCAGLQADHVANWFDMCPDYAILPFKGVYRYLTWPPGRLTRHVYPLPDPAYPFLGVHVTVTASGRVKIGPTALPAPGRENYTGVRGIRPAELGLTAVALGRFLSHSPRQSWQLVRTETRAYSRSRLARAAAALVPAIRRADLAEPAPAGIRAQLVRRSTGELEMDFLVRGDESSTHVLNAVSPAWTSSLAVAEYVVADIARRT